MRYFVTKHALTRGIQELDLEPSTMVPNYLHGPQGSMFKLGRDAFKTRREAVDAANNIRKRKIGALRKQIEKLAALKFQ